MNNLLLIFITRWVFHTKNSAAFTGLPLLGWLSPLKRGLQNTRDAIGGEVSHGRLNFTAGIFISSKIMYFKTCWFQNKNFESLLNLNCRCCRDRWSCIGQSPCPSMCTALAYTAEGISSLLGYRKAPDHTKLKPPNYFSSIMNTLLELSLIETCFC